MECRACGHINQVWNNKTLEVEHEHTQRFYRLEGEFTLNKGLYERNEEVSIYVCQICGTLVVNI